METVHLILQLISVFIIPLILVGFPIYGLCKRVPVYEEFVTGAKEGFNVAVRIIPYLVAILFAIAMFRASGAMDYLTDLLRPGLTAVGVPPEILPMAIVRPLTGSGSLGVLGDIAKQFGPDSVLTKTAATIYGSTETTFYVIAVYFGAVSVKKIRHALPVGLLADFTSILLSIYLVKLLFA
jgi:spore maturation protein B